MSLYINNAQNMPPQHVINNEGVYSFEIFTASQKLCSPVMWASCYYPFYHINNHKDRGRKFDKRLDWLARPYIERVSILDTFHCSVVKAGTLLIASSFPHAEPRQRLSTTSWHRIIIQPWTKKPYEIKSLRRISFDCMCMCTVQGRLKTLTCVWVCSS